MTDPKPAPRGIKARRWKASSAAVAVVAGFLFPTGPAMGAEIGSPAAGWDCSQGYVALTFDDGPDVSTGDRTSRILATLRDYAVHATFFVLGERVNDPNQATRPDLVRKAWSEGHTVANHSWDHPDLTRLSTSGVQSQLNRANEAITAAGAPQPTLFRPPYGYTNANVAAVGESLGLRQVIWDVNKGDTAATSTSAVSDPVLSAVRSGSVVVLHDWAPYTAEALPTILDGLKARQLCPGLLARTDTYNAQLRSSVAVVPDPNGPQTSSPRVCPCSLFTPSQAPSVLASTATGPHELGVRFAADVPGRITAIRFYKAAVNTGPHPVRLWSNSGTLLGSGTATSESNSGWQQVDIPGGIHIEAATTYVASYSAPAGRFAQDVNFFATEARSTPLRGLASTTGAANGLYATATGVFPTRTYSASNYWVDPVFMPDSQEPPQEVPVSAVDDSGSAGFQTALSVSAPGVLANDSGTGISVSAFSQPSQGSVSMTPSGGYTYTPAAGFSGPDSFTYTVTGTAGTSATATVRINVAAPVAVVARDTFTRSGSGGWGTADLGGAWTPTSSALSLDGQRGVMALSAGQTRQVLLSGVSRRDTDTTATVRLNAAPGGSGAYTSLVARRVAASVEYRGTARVQANGSVSAIIYRMNGSAAETVIGPEVGIPGLSAAPGSTLALRMRVVGANPTTLRITVWRAGLAEPAAQVTATDSTAALQGTGVTGITSSLSSRSTTAVRFGFDDVIVRQ